MCKNIVPRLEKQQFEIIERMKQSTILAILGFLAIVLGSCALFILADMYKDGGLQQMKHGGIVLGISMLIVVIVRPFVWRYVRQFFGKPKQ